MHTTCDAVAGAAASDKLLPSGRSVRVRVAGGTEELEVRSAQGEVEVRIVLTDAGPVVHLRAARLEMEAAETVAVRCRRFEVEATDAVAVASGGDVVVRGKGDITMEG